MPEMPMPSPEACLEAAHRAQDMYEEMRRRQPPEPTSKHTFRAEMFYQGGMAENNALLAIAGFLNQMHICGHGTRGWCPYCAGAIQDGKPI